MSGTSGPQAEGARLEPAAASVLIAAALAWAATISIAASPWAAYVRHTELEGIAQHEWALATLAGGWVLMVVAMMYPTVTPLVSAFGRMTAARRDRRRTRGTLLAAYTLVWIALGVVMHVGDLGLHWGVRHSGWLERNTWAIGAGTLALAGAYQFSELKQHCLRRCRSPESFLRRHWRGGSPTGQAARIGLAHGIYCVGCCWSLMLVMFAVGVGSIAWMFALTVVMVAEKTGSLGLRASPLVGAALLCSALLTAVAR